MDWILILDLMHLLAIIQPKRKGNRTATTPPFGIEDLCSSIVLHFLVAAAAQQRM